MRRRKRQSTRKAGRDRLTLRPNVAGHSTSLAAVGERALRRSDKESQSDQSAHSAALAAARVTELVQQLESTQQRLLDAQLATLVARDSSIGAAAMAAQLQAKASRLETELLEAHLETEQRERRIAGLLQQVEGMQVAVDHRDALLDSETWRVGAAILSPLRLLRRGRPATRPS